MTYLVAGELGTMTSSDDRDDVANTHHLSQSNASLKVCAARQSTLRSNLACAV